MSPRRRRPALALLAVAALAALVAGCSGQNGGQEEPTAGAAQTTVSAEGLNLGHVHNLALDGDAVLLGTHEGLYRQETGKAPVLVGEPFDVMGLTIATESWFASGHPSPGSGGPSDLGLLRSADSGATWTTLSLAGQADFHRLTASEDTVLSVNSGDGLLWRSSDGGVTWTTPGPGPFDIALDPVDPRQALATTPDGPMTSSDGGQTWTAVSDGPLIALLTWTGTGVVASGTDGSIWGSTDAGRTWTELGALAGPPTALAADGDRIVALESGQVWESLDRGATFRPRVTGLPH